jgi:membrane protein DedA with SNARE-associated domain/rhodanese-related sulfurtransferase
MEIPVDLVLRYGLALAFVSVLATQIGLPIPSFPILVVTAALSARGDYNVAQVIAIAVTACLLADFAWYRAGARYGRRVLAAMCRISLSPETCVRQTQAVYEKWGAPSLLVAKFIPGFGAVSTAMAGVVGVRPLAFVSFDAMGATLWAGAAAMIGWIFRDAVADAMRVIESAGRVGLVAVGCALALYVAFKFTQRQRLVRQLRMERVSADELQTMLQGEPAPLVIDVRSAESRKSGVIPGSVGIEAHGTEQELRGLPACDEVIIYCACPNEAAAATVAKRLLKVGFRRVRPLKGGIDAWIASGLPLEFPSYALGAGVPEATAGKPAKARLVSEAHSAKEARAAAGADAPEATGGKPAFAPEILRDIPSEEHDEALCAEA